MAKGDESNEKVQRALDFWYVTALDMFGHAESRWSERFRYWGLKRRTNAQPREDYTREVNPLIEQMGLTVRDPLEGRKYL